MKIIKVADREAMSRLASSKIIGHVLNDNRVNLSLTAGSTPTRMYEILIEELNHIQDLQNVHYYTFDETPIINPRGEVVGYDNFDSLNSMFFEPANVSSSNIHFMNDDNYDSFVDQIATDGGLDLMVIGLGEDGHFCANMPECTNFSEDLYKVDLQDPRSDFPWNQPYQDSLGENHSKYMYTLGAPSIMKVKELVLIVSGKTKAKILKQALYGPIVETCPASILRIHPNLVVIVDEEAASDI